MLGAEGSGPRLTCDHRGVREITFAEADGTGRDAPSAAEAVRIAQDAVETFGLADRVDLVADEVRHSYHAGGTLEEVADPRVRETHVVCTQLVDGHPVVTPGLGEVRVAIDGGGTGTGTGTGTTIVDATREVDRLTGSAPAAPPATREAVREPSTVDEALDAALQRLLRRVSAGRRGPRGPGFDGGRLRAARRRRHARRPADGRGGLRRRAREAVRAGGAAAVCAGAGRPAPGRGVPARRTSEV